MFSRISWGEFISTIIFLSTLYYLAIIILYYRKDILKWPAHGFQLDNRDRNEVLANSTQRENQKAGLSSNESRPMSYNEMTVASIEESLVEENKGSNKRAEAKFSPTDVHELIEELKAIFSDAQQKKMIKQELILSIQHKLASYKQLKGTDIENEIIYHIANESKEKCAVDLDKNDLENLWKL